MVERSQYIRRTRSLIPLPVGDVPAETQCVTLCIPAGSDYRRQLFGMLYEFTHWLNYEKDDSHKGALVAQAWKAAIMQGMLSCYQFRVHDGVDEFSSDGGATWQAVDLLNDGLSGHDPRTDAPLLPARTGSNIPCLSAANATACFVELHREIIKWWNDAAVVLIFCGAISTLLEIFFGIGWLTFYLTVNYMTYVNQILNYTDALTEASFSTVVQNALTCIFYTRADANGRWDEISFAQVLADIANMSGDIWRLIEIYVTSIGGYVGLNNAGVTNSVAVYDCAACTAQHCHIWDFTISTQGWNFTDGTTRDSGGIIDGNNPDGAYINYPTDYNIDVISITLYFNGAWTGDSPAIYIRTRTGLTIYKTVTGAQPATLVIPMGMPISSLGLVADRKTGGIQHFGTLRLQAVKIIFNGSDPYGGDNC